MGIDHPELYPEYYDAGYTPEYQPQEGVTTLKPYALGLSNAIDRLKQSLRDIDNHERTENDKLTDDLLGRIESFQNGHFTQPHQVKVYTPESASTFTVSSLDELNAALD